MNRYLMELVLLQWMAKMADWFTPYDANFFESTNEAQQWLKD
ncbi:hypothetical protein [Shewanella sp. KX20019]|nr:hypothetical protein [Shewanella sp. KX20019]